MNSAMQAELTPDVSVILPIYNAAPYLDQALTSARRQTLDNIEIICVNDGSTDSSLDIINKHAALDSRIRVANRTNHGYGASMNFGIDMAQGTYIAILEPDDWIEPDMFASMFCYAAEFDDLIDIVKTPYWRVCNPDTPDQRILNCRFKGRVTPAMQPFNIFDPGTLRLLRHHPCIWSALYRRQFLIDNNIRFHEIPGAGWADNPFMYDTLLRARTIVYLDEAFYCYREETPEKSRAFAQNCTSVPFDRWQDMQDIIEQLNVSDEGILRVHNELGFYSYSLICENVEEGNPVLAECAHAMFDRMDADRVLADPDISPSLKRVFAQARGIENPRIDTLGYLKKLASEGVYELKNNGPDIVAAQAKAVLDHR